ncbi:MAG: hypothetical protein ACRDK5_08335 [Solirubrobacterales bacterium]
MVGPWRRRAWNSWRGFLSAREEYRVEADAYRELDRERVLVLTGGSGRGKTSGLELGRMRLEPAPARSPRAS